MKSSMALTVVALVLVTGCANEVRPSMERCVPSDGAHCPADCIPVITSHHGESPRCRKDGVMLGCVPSDDSGYWVGAFPEIVGVCDRPIADPSYYYCLEGKKNIAFYYANASDFCGVDGCSNVQLASDCQTDENATR